MSAGVRKTKEVVAYALSDADIKHILGHDTSVISYPEFAQMSDIDEAFDKKGRCILLFLRESDHEGHWCCMLRKPDHIEFFDPYGDPPQAQLADIPKSRLEQMNEARPYLMALLKKKGIPVYYNNHAFQQMKNSVATCGRHCVVRCYYSKLPLEEYAALIKKSGLTPDEFVAGATYKLIRK